MKYRFLVAAMCLLLGICGSLTAVATTVQKFPGPNILGTWEGESKCTATDPACRDEHVIYRVATVRHVPGKLALHVYKVVKGQLIFMGTLECIRDSGQAALSCTDNMLKKNAWEFTISGRTMTGTLTIGEEKTLYRRINVKKK